MPQDIPTSCVLEMKNSLEAKYPTRIIFTRLMFKKKYEYFLDNN